MVAGTGGLSHVANERLAGASVDELVRNCGLNIGEAKLMQKLHGKTRVASRS